MQPPSTCPECPALCEPSAAAWMELHLHTHAQNTPHRTRRVPRHTRLRQCAFTALMSDNSRLARDAAGEATCFVRRGEQQLHQLGHQHRAARLHHDVTDVQHEEGRTGGASDGKRRQRSHVDAVATHLTKGSRQCGDEPGVSGNPTTRARQQWRHIPAGGDTRAATATHIPRAATA